MSNTKVKPVKGEVQRRWVPGLRRPVSGTTGEVSTSRVSRRKALFEKLASSSVPPFRAARWVVPSLKVSEGQSLGLEVQVHGMRVPGGTRLSLEIRNGEGVEVAKVEAKVAGSAARTRWVFFFPPDSEGASSSLRFRASYGRHTVESDVLQVARSALGWLEISLQGDRGAARFPGAPFRVTRPSGAVVHEGSLDDDAFARVEGIQVGPYKVSFPDLAERTDWIELSLQRPDGSPAAPGTPFLLVSPGGEVVRKGRLDDRARSRVEGLKRGPLRVVFPALES